MRTKDESAEDPENRNGKYNYVHGAEKVERIRKISSECRKIGHRGRRRVHSKQRQAGLHPESAVIGDNQENIRRHFQCVSQKGTVRTQKTYKSIHRENEENIKNQDTIVKILINKTIRSYRQVAVKWRKSAEYHDYKHRNNVRICFKKP